MHTTVIQWGLQIQIYSADENKGKDTKYICTVILSLEGS